jgi:hypothetical protein
MKNHQKKKNHYHHLRMIPMKSNHQKKGKTKWITVIQNASKLANYQPD